MRRAALLTVVLLAGCGGRPSDREAVADAWVEAVEARDWDRACELSVPAPEEFTCPDMLEAAFGSSEPSVDRGDLQLERVDGDWRVHFEVQVIR